MSQKLRFVDCYDISFFYTNEVDMFPTTDGSKDINAIEAARDVS